MEIRDHLYPVPFVAEPDDTRFFQLFCRPQGDETLSEGTVIMNYELSAEEREILQRFEQGELRSATSAPHEMEMAHEAARNAINEVDKQHIALRYDSSPSGVGSA